jgi:hypothetical protein
MNPVDQIALQAIAAEYGIWREYYYDDRGLQFHGVVDRQSDYRVMCRHGAMPDPATPTEFNVRRDNIVTCSQLFLFVVKCLTYYYRLGRCEDCGMIHAVRVLVIGERR